MSVCWKTMPSFGYVFYGTGYSTYRWQVEWWNRCIEPLVRRRFDSVFISRIRPSENFTLRFMDSTHHSTAVFRKMPFCDGNSQHPNLFLACGNSTITSLWGCLLAFWNFEVDYFGDLWPPQKYKLAGVKMAPTNQDGFPASEEHSKNKLSEVREV